MHPRARPHMLASAEFGVFWAKLQRKLGIKTYEQGFLVLNQLERFWLEASMEGLSVDQTAERWERVMSAKNVVERMTGDELVKFVQEYSLTYGEIFSVLVEVRSTAIKYYIRGERHPDDPDKPGGLA